MWAGHSSVMVTTFHGHSRQCPCDFCVRPVETHPSAELGLEEQERLSDDHANDVIIKVETVPSVIQRHLPSNQMVPGKLVTSSFRMVSSASDIHVTDSQTLSPWNDRKAEGLLRFSTSLNESFSQTLRIPESVGIDAPCSSHENIQGSKTLGQSS